MQHEIKNDYLAMNTENLKRVVTMKDFEIFLFKSWQNTHLLRLCTIHRRTSNSRRRRDKMTVWKICPARSWKTCLAETLMTRPKSSQHQSFWKILRSIRLHVSQTFTGSARTCSSDDVLHSSVQIQKRVFENWKFCVQSFFGCRDLSLNVDKTEHMKKVISE